jgi:hypothetical protein
LAFFWVKKKDCDGDDFLLLFVVPAPKIECKAGFDYCGNLFFPHDLTENVLF